MNYTNTTWKQVTYCHAKTIFNCIYDKEREWTQEQIAHRIGVTQPTVSRFIESISKNARIYYRNQPTKVFGVGYDLTIWELSKNETNKKRIQTCNKNKEWNYRHFNEFAHSMIQLKTITGKSVKYSPMAIIQEYKNEYPEHKYYPSKSQFYNWIHQEKYGYRKHMFPYMTSRKAWKVPKKQVKPKKYNNIRNRPIEANLRSELGHWELDTMVGKRTDKFVFVTLVERKTGQFKFAKIKRDALSLAITVNNLLSGEIVKSITMDNGGENNELDRFFDHKILFNCDAYCSWQKGQLENTHRFVRRFFPKQNSFDNIIENELKEIEGIINSYPSRKQVISGLLEI